MVTNGQQRRCSPNLLGSWWSQTSARCREYSLENEQFLHHPPTASTWHCYWTSHEIPRSLPTIIIDHQQLRNNNSIHHNDNMHVPTSHYLWLSTLTALSFNEMNLENTFRYKQSQYDDSANIMPMYVVNQNISISFVIRIMYAAVNNTSMYQHLDVGQSSEWVSEQCFTSPPTQYRLYGRRFLQVKRPNQQCQSTEGRSTNADLLASNKHHNQNNYNQRQCNDRQWEQSCEVTI